MRGAVALMYQPALLNRLSIIQGLFQGIENKVCFRRPRDPPADNAISKRIDGERHIELGMGAPSVRELCRAPCQVHSQVKSLPAAIGAFRVVDVERKDVAELHNKHRAIPYQANRTLGVLSKMFNLAEIWGLRPDGSNPCRHVPKYREKKRERFLSQEELQRLGQVLSEAEAEGSETPFIIAAFRLLILTGCRLGEIQTLKWEYITPRHMELPDTKTGARRIPLPQAARDVLDALPRYAGNPYVVAGKLEGRFATDFQHPWRRIRARADLRHTYASMVGRLLGHSQLQTTMRYAHLADDPVLEAAQQNAN